MKCGKNVNNNAKKDVTAMKKMWGGVVVTVLLLAILAGIWIFDRPASVAAEEVPLAVSGERMLGVWEERLALFETGNPLPTQVYEVWIATLPETEQQRLLAGIAVTDESMLQSLLEDYTG